MVLSAQMGPESARAISCAVPSVRWTEGQGAAGGRPANWRWIAVEKRSRVKLLDDVWHTAPNHSRPQPCVAEVDVDAED
jgi:hypothetical protein